MAADAGRLSAEEKGKQKADADLPRVGVLRPAQSPGPTTEIEEALPSPPPPPPPFLLAVRRNEAALDCLLAELQQLRGDLDDAVRSHSKRLQGGEPRPSDEARWRAGAGAGVGVPLPGHSLGRKAAASEIEEAPPSPPPLSKNQAALGSMLAELEQMRRGLGLGEGSPSTMFLQGGEPRPGNEASRRPLGPSAASEIEELPPSPPPPLSRRLLAPDAAVAAVAPAGMASELGRKRAAAAAAMENRLQQLRRERGGEGASSRRPESGEPRRHDAGGRAAVIETLEREAGTMRDRLVALRLQQEEMQALRKSLDASQEFWKPVVPVHQRNNSKIGVTCNWNRIISVIALASGSVLVILFRTLFPLGFFTHIVGAITLLWILGSIAFCRQLFGKYNATKGFCRHVAQLVCVCFLLLFVYTLYFISRAVTSAALV